MDEPIAWLVTTVDGAESFVTTDPNLAGAGQRALPLYTSNCTKCWHMLADRESPLYFESALAKGE